MKDGAIVCNSGHFDVEIDLEDAATSWPEGDEGRRATTSTPTYCPTAATVYVLGDGRLVNLAAAEGHPASVMDMSFATQALAAEWAVKNQKTLTPKVYDVPTDVEDWVAKLKLSSMGIRIDSLTKEQEHYLSSWAHGT